MNVHVIGDRDTVLGFRLNGTEGTIVTDSAQARRALDSAMEDSQVGLVLVTHRWSEAMREQMDRLRMRHIRPVVVEIPGKELEPPRTPIRELVRRAIGMRIDAS